MASYEDLFVQGTFRSVSYFAADLEILLIWRLKSSLLSKKDVKTITDNIPLMN